MSADIRFGVPMAEVKPVRVGEVDELVAPVVLAFSADPFVRWMLSAPSQFFRFFPQLTRAHGERTAPSGGVFAWSDGSGAAFWYPPGIAPDGDRLGAIFTEAGVRDKVSAIWEVAAEYEPGEPHWYLRQIGIDPRWRGHGLGGPLLQAGLAEIDLRREIAYLEATSVQSRGFYERHGFRQLGEVQVGDSAPLWPMLREPR